MGKVAVVTGASSGIGLECARELAARGISVYDFSRRGADLPGVKHISCDVTDEEAVNAAVKAVFDREGRIDILVSNAGYGISGAVEFTDVADAEKQLNVNLFGCIRTVRAVLPYMRAAGCGRIVCTSSVAAVVPIPFQTYYSVSKAAVNSFVMALANEVRPYGITVCAVMPGDIRTGFTDSRNKNTAGDSEYGGRISRSVSTMEKDERGGMPASKAGRFIASVATKNGHKPLYTIGFGYKCAVMLTKLLPARALNRLIGAIYSK